jgi:hypothetical protein
VPNRILKESICTSDNLDSLDAEQERFFYRLLVQCDDYGRFDGRALIVKAACFPLKQDVTPALVELWLSDLHDAGLVRVYDVDGKPYIQVATWEKHQHIRAKRSKFPAPNGNSTTHDFTCSQAPADVPVIQSESNPNPIQGVGKPTAPKKEKAKSKRSEKSFPPENYTTVTEAYKTLKGVEPQGDEWKPIQQTVKSMFLDGRTVDQIVGFMQALTDSPLEWTDNWTMKTVRMKLAEWLAGKLDLTERQTGRGSNPDDEQTSEQVALYHSLLSRARSCQAEIALERQRDVLDEEDRQRIAVLDQERARHLEAAADVKRKLKERGVDVEEKRR